MKEKEILDRFINNMPLELEGEERKLFMAIMKIADINDELSIKIKKIKTYLLENAYHRDDEDVLHKGLTGVEIDELEAIINE